MSDAIRWKQRFENFERAYLLLREAFEKDPAAMSDLEKEGVIQRFEYTFELAWKTLKDYLVYSGVVFDQITPRSGVRRQDHSGRPDLDQHARTEEPHVPHV